MIAFILALQAVQATPVRPTTVQVRPSLAVAAISPKQRKISEARSLLADAVKVQADYAPRAGQPSKAEMKSQIDSMSEMGETESLRLQMAMDRMSKMMSTLSNLLKKISDTSDAIVQNIK